MSCEYFADKGMKIEGNYWLVHPHTGETWDEASVEAFIAAYQPPNQSEDAIALRKAALIREIKRAVYDCLEAQQWRVTKVQEHLLMAQLSRDDVQQQEATVSLRAELVKREALRKKSDEAEQQVTELTSIEALDAFSFTAAL
ncbi:hypothetical protein [Pseudoalteromonas sp. OOF1S-7]|uniref:hypothetical protein n=1 Tax=Pseudoalteromonas sp. OOF1S-7 TaxID=2917757 RepID=UPI001EF3E8FA|nr:hypothetical protein [Pseudoalteromonas sp. OOF1S-7]MCG7536492.1 hypothetical protein [Pseudoalteromonas sp. OOF1S-7]